MTLNKATAMTIGLVVALACVLRAAPLIAQAAPTILTSPTETPGQFTYAFVDPAANDGRWVAIDFHRDPGCSAISGFNLLTFVDFPNAFTCPLTMTVKESWLEDDLAVSAGPWQTPPWLANFRTPTQAAWVGNGAVPIYFVDVLELLDAVADGDLTIADLRSFSSLRVGYATEYWFIQLNSTRSNSHPTMRDGQTQTVAKGLLQDGRSFHFQRHTHGPSVTSLRIDFK